ncbi:MAG: phage holin family protein [Gemmatimonadota bacterium]
MARLLFRLLINAIALYAATELVPGIHFTGDLWKLLLVAAIFGLVNAVVKPVVALLTCPLALLTLGLFTFVINALMLQLTAWLSSGWNLGFRVDSFWAALWGGLLIGVVSLVLSLLIPDTERAD